MEFAELAALASGHAEARAIQTALKLGVFDAIGRGPLDADALAHSIGADPRASSLLANAMVALGLLAVDAGHYLLTDTSRRFLAESSPEYLGDLILFDEAIFEHWSLLGDAIRSGAPVRTPDMFQNRPEETARFIRAMDSLTRARGDARYVAEHLDLSNAATIVDVGGGPGTYVAAMLNRWPNLRATICDLPATLEVARAVLAEREPAVAARIDLARFDYLHDEIPARCGAVFMSNIIHSEDEATVAEIFRKCYRALEPGGLVVVKDHIMNADLTSPRAGAIFSLQLLLFTHGSDYSFDKVAKWLTGAGFVDVRCEELPSPPFTSSMVVARKP